VWYGSNRVRSDFGERKNNSSSSSSSNLRDIKVYMNLIGVVVCGSDVNVIIESYSICVGYNK